MDTSCTSGRLYASASYPIGTCVDVARLKTNAAYQQIVVDQFNSLTPENCFKFDQIHPMPGQYYWADADYLVEFGRVHHKRIHGHTLIWHKQLPAWLDDYSGDWQELLHDHTSQTVKRYGNDITSWDVVNEALNEDGTLRNTAWLSHLGPAYIRQAFLAAHEANADALLFYNDYNLELNPVKLDAAINLCRQLRLSGARVDGIGMQMHVTGSYPSIGDIEQVARKIADAGFLVHFSELDVSMNPDGTKQSFSENDLRDQAARYFSIVRTYNQLASGSQHGITVWGVSDADSWIMPTYNRKDIPLLFDTNYVLKPAYCAVKNMLL